jgi:dihydropteroate synthase
MRWTSPHETQLPDWQARTLLMGIVNVTPDSFSDGGKINSPEAAADLAEKLSGDGADVIDVGAESTRPGATPVEITEELRRLIPAIQAIRKRLPKIAISADTYRCEVAEAAIAAGADILNDVWGAAPDSPQTSLATVAASCRCPWILMHNRAVPVYQDFWPNIIEDFRRALDRAEKAGIPRHQLWIDPGFGFGKSHSENLEVLSRLNRITSLGLPVLLGTSRKSTLGKVLQQPDPLLRGAGDAVCATWGIQQGAAMLRVHDVAAVRPVVQMADALRQGQRWTSS